MQAYSDPKRERDPYALPDLEVFQLTATEAAEMDEELVWEYLKRPEFKLATMNSRVRAQMLDTMVEEQGITGGWYYWFCFPGCLPDSAPYGPCKSERAALRAARQDAR